MNLPQKNIVCPWRHAICIKGHKFPLGKAFLLQHARSPQPLQICQNHRTTPQCNPVERRGGYDLIDLDWWLKLDVIVNVIVFFLLFKKKIIYQSLKALSKLDDVKNLTLSDSETGMLQTVLKAYIFITDYSA